MNRPSRLAQLAIVLSLTTICAGCASQSQVVDRMLPPEASVVLDPVPLPDMIAGQDARVALAQSRSVAAQNITRLKTSRIIYRGIRKRFSGK